MKRHAVFCLLLTILFTRSLFGDIGDWTTYTNKSDIRDIDLYQNTLWCATNGGVFAYRLADSTFQGYTNTSGLSSNDVKTLAVDSHGNIWFGHTGGEIDVFNVEAGTWSSVDDYVGRVIYDFKFYGDSLFVALDIGVSLYDIARKEVKETYKNLGVGFQVEIPVTNLYLYGKDIWVGTDFGIAKSNLDKVNLLAPESWTNYTPTNSGIISKKVRAIVMNDGHIYAGTDEGISRFDGNTWATVNNGLTVAQNRDIYSLATHNDTLYAGTSAGVYRLRADDQWIRIGSPFRDITSIFITEQGDVWVGRAKTKYSQGFSFCHHDSTSWVHMTPPGPAGNNFKSLVVDEDGVLWCCSTSDGISRFDGEIWSIYTTDNYPFSYNDFWAVDVDDDNNKWFANWGSGAVKIDSQDSMTVYSSGYLSGIDNAPDYIPVTNTTVDRNNNVWFTVYGASDGNVVAVVTPDGRWQYFSTADGVRTNTAKELYGITVDRYNRMWVGSRSGITVIDHNNTLFDKSDDDLTGTLTTSDGLVNNDVRCLAEDLDGVMWLGTNQGLNYWQAGVVYDKGGVIHDNIQSITVDVRNNKWFGTVSGVSVLADDNYTYTHYTTENSPLVGANVTSIAFDENTGKVYIGTTSGLSCLETPYAKAQINLDNVTAGPNPYILREGADFTIYKLANNVTIKILSPEGMLVRHIPKDEVQGFYQWDGRNDSGDLVSSGIYLYLIYSEETGDSKVGKVAVIRE
ncbi:hypothetical protein JXB12_10540 [candidate division KSB1 bacterium]|nr:hypothetical protein [candidate division KSB1 bacterium]